MRKNSVGTLRQDLDDLSIAHARLNKKIKYMSIAVLLLFVITIYGIL